MIASVASFLPQYQRILARGDCVGISGSTVIGERCMIGGAVGIAGHLSICDDVIVTGQSLVAGDIRKPGMYSSALSVDESRRFRKNAARFNQLDQFVREVRSSGAADVEPDDSQES